MGDLIYFSDEYGIFITTTEVFSRSESLEFSLMISSKCIEADKYYDVTTDFELRGVHNDPIFTPSSNYNKM